MCEKMLFMETNGVQTKKQGRKLCVTNSHSEVHGIISMNKPLKFLTKIIVPLISNVDFFSNFKEF
jgi:hypothetical protein